MRILRDLPVRRKLYASFGCLVVLLGAVIGIAVWGMSDLGASHRRVSEHVVPQVIAADMTMSAALNMHFSQTAYVLDPKGILAGAPAHTTFEADFHAYLDQLAVLKRVTPPALRHDLAAVVAASDHWAALDRQLWQAVQAGRAQEARTLVLGASNDVNDQLVGALSTYQTDITKVEAQANASFRSTQSSVTWLMVAVGTAAVLVALLLATLIARSLARPLRQLVGAARGIAEGDVKQTVEVRSRDELGETAAAFARMVEYLEEMAAAAERIAAGDLTVQVETRSERDALGHAFARMAEQLRAAIRQVARAADAVGSSSHEMASTSHEAGRAVGEIAQAVGDVASGAERQTRMVEQARSTAEQTGEAAQQAREAATEGVAAAREASEAMEALRASTADVTDAIRELAEKSERIGGIVETITSIAGQTNLLALNAAIEAARAGDQGRGFAVVADEVRKLAEESQQAAASIGALIDEIQAKTQRTVAIVEEGARRTDGGVGVVERARDAFERIGVQIAEVSERTQEIVNATAEVAAVAEQTSASTEEVSASTQQTASSAQQIASSALALEETASQLQGLVAQFTVGSAEDEDEVAA